MGRGRRSGLTAEEKAAVWPLVRAGANWPAVAAELGRSVSTVMIYAWSTGGVQPRARCRSPRQLTLGDREEISRGIAEGLSMRSIAASIGRPASTVSREIGRNGGPRRYRAHVADQSAWAQGRRPKARKLAATPRLRAIVEEKLADDWSPQQISRWLRRVFADDPELLSMSLIASDDLRRGVAASE